MEGGNTIPKKLNDVRGQLLAEARRQAEAAGYSGMTIRSVAEGCAIAAGTVYNYFPSKDVLVASFVLEDWNECIEKMRACFEAADGDEAAIYCIWSGIRGFIDEHEKLFSGEDAERLYAISFSERHAKLRGQIAEVLSERIHDEFLTRFIAESLITWTVDGVPFGELYPILKKLL